jgi:single-stranded-DNA-specific exonuclease
VAQLLANRGLEPHAPALPFLSPQLGDLYPPHLLPGASDAAAVITSAIQDKTPIVLYGDYDVDGTTGLAILWHMLERCGAAVSYYVPHRVDEGYGLNLEAVRKLTCDGAGLMVTIDCGVTAIEEAEALAAAGTRLVITDHHAPRETLPTAAAVVHPALDRSYPNPHLSGAGVAFKLAWAIAKQLSGNGSAPTDRVHPAFRQLLIDLLPLAALGTIADAVPLCGENRVIARHGLLGLAKTTLPGLRQLMEVAEVSGDRVDGYDVGFRLAPRINAAGRMGHARLAVELLTRADADRAREIAMYLDDQNRSRRAAERKILQQAVERIEAERLAGDGRRGLVLADERWHAGVIGIVAARLVDRYRRPTVLISLASGEGQGSARSIESFDIGDALSRCREHLIAYGGHTSAAGLRIASERIPAFTEAFVSLANNRLTGDDLNHKLRLDAEVALRELSLPLVETVLGLGPFGEGNAKPRFATGWVELADEPRVVGSSGDHLQAAFHENGVRIKGIGFGLASAAENLKQHRRCRVAFEPMVNEFNGRRTVELQIIDLRFPH